MNATPDQQQDLLALADIDEEIRRLEHRRSHLPEQVRLDDTSATLGRVLDELIDATQREERLEAQSRRHERELADVESARKSEDARMYSGQIQSEKALHALKTEIADLRRRKGDLEDSLLETMEQLEDVQGIVATLTARREELIEQETALTTARDEAATDIDAELVGAARRRDEAAAGLPDPLVDHYDALRAKRKGGVVARLVGRTCTGCQLELTAIQLEEIKQTAKTGLAHCEQCGLIIVPT